MMTMKIYHYSKILNVISGSFFELIIENPFEYYFLGKKIIDCDDTAITLYDGDIKENGKNILVIQNLFDIDPNSKKNLNVAYKKISISCSNEMVNRLISDINKKTYDLFDLISQDFDASITYETDVKLIDLLGLYNFRYNLCSNLFIENFVSFIKASLQNTNFKIVITFNLFDFIDEENYRILKKEFEYMNLALLNVSSKKSTKSVDERIIIDNDLCEI